MNLLMEGRYLLFSTNETKMLCGFHVAIQIADQTDEKLKNKAILIVKENLARFPEIAVTDQTKIVVLDWLMDDNNAGNAGIEFKWFRQKKWYEFWKSRHSEYGDSLHPIDNSSH